MKARLKGDKEEGNQVFKKQGLVNEKVNRIEARRKWELQRRRGFGGREEGRVLSSNGHIGMKARCSFIFGR